MVTVILNILISAFICFLWGKLLLQAFKKHIQEEIKAEISILIGLVGLAFFSSCLHLFLPIQWPMKILVILLSFIPAILNKSILVQFYQFISSKISLLLILVAALSIYIRPGTGDIGDYHLQAMKWAEYSGNVSGLGNFNRPLANNNWWFNLQSLLGFGELSLYVLNGLLFVICFSYLIHVYQKNEREFFLHLGFVLFLTMSCKTAFVGSVTPDFVVSCLIFINSSLFLQAFQSNKTENFKYILIILLSCFAITVKLNAAPLALLALVAFVMIIRQNKTFYLPILISLTAIIFFIPWLIGNVIVSGWLAYPVDGINLFQVDWKVPKEVLQFERFSIIQWGKLPGGDIYKTAQLSLMEWLPGWFKFHDVFNRAMMLLALVSILITMWFQIKQKNMAILFLLVLAIVGIAFCFSNGPHIRYTFGYMWILIGLGLYSISHLIPKIFTKSFSYPLLFVALLLAGSKYIHRPKLSLFEVNAYPKIAIASKDWNMNKVYITKTNSSCWDQFPCSYYMVENCKMRGTKLDEGFRVER
jgi:hypothetical protein